MSKKIDTIRKQNAQWARETPYNHCDRWCERCPIDIQKNCTLYLDEMGRKAANIAHGRDPDNLEILEEELEDKFKSLESSPWAGKENSLFDDMNSLEVDEETNKKFEELENKVDVHHVSKAVWQYFRKAHEFLKGVGYSSKSFPAPIAYHLQTIAWYHTLLSAKMKRALSGVCETDEGEFREYEVYDAVAQLDICRKAVTQSQAALKALEDLMPSIPSANSLQAMLDNIGEQIKLIERDIEERL